MAIFRGVGGSGDSSDNSFLQEVTAQANAAEASATSAANSLTALQNTSIIELSELQTITSQSNLNLKFNSNGSQSTSLLKIFNDNTNSTALEVNSLGKVGIGGSVSGYTSVPRDDNTLSIGTMAIGITASEAVVGIKGETGKPHIALQAPDSGETTAITLTDNNAFVIGKGISSLLTLTNSGNLSVGGTVEGRDVAYDGSKLDTIEAGATADQTDAEIKTAYENNADTNVFTDADHTKLDGIETSATADQTGAEIKTAYEAEADTNAFTDADHSKLDGIEANATADQTGAEIKSAYEAVADTNAFTDAEKTKLSGIEASADVTDATNVTSAGALMDSEVTNLAQVKAFDSSDYATSAQGTTADSALPKAGGQMTGNITFSGTQTVDGRDLSADGSKLDTLLYHRVSELRLAGNTSAGNWLYLSTSDQNLGQATNIYHPSTPDDTTRLVDVEWTTYWVYTSVQNDTRLTLQLIVPVGATTQNLGAVTEVSLYDPNYVTRGYGQKWYYVSGDVTHHFTPFGRMSQSSSGSLEHTVVSSQYDPNTNRTYFCLKISTAGMVTGNTAYWHPYAFESTYTTLTQSYDITERYRSGLDRNKVSFKLPFTDATLTFRLKIKELASGDSAQVADSVVKLTSMGV